MRTLFLRIFLSFWAAMLLVLSWSSPSRRSWSSFKAVPAS